MDNATALKIKIANNQINLYITSVEDLMTVWQRSQNKRVGRGLPQTCYASHAQNVGKTNTYVGRFSNPTPVAYHAHGRVKKTVISDMKDLDGYLLERVTYAKKNITPNVSPVLDAFVLARVTKDLGINGMIIPKVINGRQYIAFTGHAGLRTIFTGPII